MVRMLQNDQFPTASMGPDEAQGQFVRLARRVDEITDVECVRQSRSQALGVVGQVAVQVTRIGTQETHLAICCLNYFGMAMADVGHVVECIQIGTAEIIKKVLSPATD